MADNVGKLNVIVAGSVDSSLTAATAKATADAEKLASALQRQLNQYNLVGRSVEVYELRLRGASDQVVQHVQTLQQELQAFQQQAAAQREQQAALDRGVQITRAMQTAEEAHAARLSELNALLQRGALTQETYNRAVRATQASLAAASVRELTAAERARETQMQRGIQITQSAMTSLERYRNELRELRGLLSAGAISQDTFNRSVLNAQRAFAAAGSMGGGRGLGANVGLLAVQQLAFGAQDAATVYGNMGFAGAVRAASNNVIQFGSLIHPLAGILTAFAGTGIALWVDGMDRATKQQEKLEEQTRKSDQSIRKMTEAIQLQGDVFREQQRLKDLSGTDELKGGAKGKRAREAELQAENDALIAARNERLPELARLQRDQAALDRGEDPGSIASRRDLEGFNGVSKTGGVQMDAEQRNARIKALQEEQAKINEQLGKNNAELARVTKDREALEKRLAESQKDDAALKVGKERLNKIAEQFENDMKLAEQVKKDREKKVQDQKTLRRQILGDSREGKVQAVMDEAKERLAKVRSLDLRDKERAELEKAIFAGAEQQLTAIGKAHKTKENLLAGSASFGSREAFERVALSGVRSGKDPVDENTRRLIEEAKKQLKAMKDVKEAVKSPPKLEVANF